MHMREIATKNSNSGQGHVLHYITSFESCLACQHSISDWLGKLKPDKLSTECQKELKGVAAEKAMNPGGQFLFSSQLRHSVKLPTKPHATQASIFSKQRQTKCIKCFVSS